MDDDDFGDIQELGDGDIDNIQELEKDGNVRELELLFRMEKIIKEVEKGQERLEKKFDKVIRQKGIPSLLRMKMRTNIEL